MKQDTTNFRLHVDSEIGPLKRLLIHSPDNGLGKVVPSKAQDWLFEDIVHLETIRKKEYDYYIKVLLYFLDTDKIKGKLKDIDADKSRSFYKPGHKNFYASDYVIEFEKLFAEILQDENLRKQIIAAVCAYENCTYALQTELATLAPAELAQVIISGSIGYDRMIFAPIPNFIFTRDIGIAINNYLLLNKPAKKARSREALIARYIFFNHPIFNKYRDNIIEINNSQQNFLRPEENTEENTLEGGDVMVISKNHVLIGHSERTSASGINETIKALFSKNVADKITVIKIPHKRDFMHIDTVFTQVRKDMWVILHTISQIDTRGDGSEPVDHLVKNKLFDKLEITQFHKSNVHEPQKFDSLEQLLSDISENELGAKQKTTFIYSGNKKSPYASREQWTDSCNLLAIREGIVLGYDRNEHTIQAFKDKGFKVIPVKNLIQKFENDELNPNELENTFITMPSAELSRARGGFHCMSLPLERDILK